MAKVITFSRVFPSYHPRKGEPTYFVEKMIQWYWDNISDVMEGYHNVPTMLQALNLNKFSKDFYQEFSDCLNPEVNEWKSHTIRAGHRFKQGEFFRPCVWTGKPYRSLQMQFLPALMIPKTWNFYRDEWKWEHPGNNIETIAANDGLTTVDFLDWFQLGKQKKFDGQIICWNQSIEYV